ncbi:MAG: SGNH/GDSL hydrolase family protein [Scandinavium sp.]|uniref:SGNH/GDSL hydrolase family protein n=1 Tax=Scandinavium sp. TaxID=2830653 RepID=UPI003F2EE266
MPLIRRKNRERQTGSVEVRNLPSYFSRLQRLQLVRTTAVPVMVNPPTPTLAQGQGLVSVTIANSGAGYSVGDSLTPTRSSAFAGRIYVTAVNGSGAVTTAAVMSGGCYSDTSATPMSVTGGSGSGAQFAGAFKPVAASSIYNPKLYDRTNEAAFQFTGYSPQDITSGYRGNGVQNGTQMIIEFQSDTPVLYFRMVGGNYQGDLYVDGQRISGTPIKTDSSGASYIYHVQFGDGSQNYAAVRHYELRGINTGFGGVAVPQQYGIWRPDMVQPPLAWVLGDSYTVGIGAVQGSFNDMHIMGQCLGLRLICDGISGAGFTSIQDGRVPQDRVALKLGSITEKPQFIFLNMGYNDAPAGHIEQFQTNFRATVAKSRELCPLAQIIVIGPATPLGRVSNITAIRQTLMDLCNELVLPFVDVDDLVNASNKSLYTGADNTHPTPAGHVFRGVRLAQLVSRII